MSSYDAVFNRFLSLQLNGYRVLELSVKLFGPAEAVFNNQVHWSVWQLRPLLHILYKCSVSVLFQDGGYSYKIASTEILCSGVPFWCDLNIFWWPPFCFKMVRHMVGHMVLRHIDGTGKFCSLDASETGFQTPTPSTWNKSIKTNLFSPAQFCHLTSILNKRGRSFSPQESFSWYE